ncbi:hypothetical protein GCM10028824_20390 [Hymenobacter segetis]|uniref:IPT/TIG domain-containing protein n=1 Tax=Hymenobacter segetis TaxID=2025509 RepID=A0ABU9LRR5_9BACT
MNYSYFKQLLACFVGWLCLGPALASAAPFTPGNIVVTRVGDGTAALTTAATAVYLDEYTPAGVLVQSVALPTAVTGNNRILTASGNATSELVLSRTGNGRSLLLAGYGTAPGTTGVAASTAADVARVVGVVSPDGTVDTSTSLGNAFSASNVRAVASADGTNLYVVGGNSGVQYVTFGGFNPTQLNTAPTNLRGVSVAGGNLYISAASSPYIGLSTVGTGLPTAAGQTVAVLPGFPATTAGSSPYGFYFADLSTTVPGVDVVYVADDRSVTGGGIQKWSLVAGTWTLNGIIAGSATATVRGLDGNTSGTTVSLIATSATGLYLLSDTTGYNVAPTLTSIPAPVATAATNTAFRGIAFAPVAPAPVIASFSPTSGPVGTTITVTGSNLTGTTALTLNGVAVTGFTVVNATTITFAVPTGATSGPIAVTTPGGTATSTGTFTVTVPNPTPAITSLSPASVAQGSGPFTLTIIGTGFLPTSTVTFSGTSLPATYISATQLSISLPTGAVVGTYPVIVTNPAQGGGASAPFNFIVTPAATITALLPNTTVAGSAAFTLTVTGTNFVSGSVVSFNGIVLTTTFVSATQLTATVPASSVATVGTFNVTVTNPANSISAAATFTVTVPAPTITSFTPTTGGPGTLVTITGTNFTGATAVRIGSFNVPNFTVVNATTITAALPTGTGSVNGLIMVTTPGGTATSATSFNLVSATLASQALPGLSVFPNPATDNLTVALPSAAPATVALRDLTGRLVLAPAPLGADKRLALPAALASGVYFLEVQQEGLTAVRRIEKR